MSGLIREPRRLYQDIADRLRILISDESFAPKGRLPAERDLAKQLGVSRPSVREALIALEIAGEVEIKVGSGVYAKPRNPNAGVAAPAPRAADGASIGESPLDILRARSLIEGALIAEVAPKIRPKDLRAIREAFAQMKDAVEQGVTPVDADRLFHVRIAEASGNAVLERLIGSLYDERHSPLWSEMRLRFEGSDTWDAALDEHAQILDALENRDALQAQAAMARHLKASHERLMTQLKG
jgi:GntR family transcriptional regulator, transcriptional repressor for pyruvate dehydrogenase complex